ncbi:SDR family oxidoreductase [Pseudoneobacillus sp. C159]
MKILIIGGTRFLGRYLVEEGLKKNHEITLFNRGNNKTDFNHVEQIHGDRNMEISLLENRKWDAVIDTCGYWPQSVEKSAEILKENVGQYVLISTISVYKDFSKKNFDEESDLLMVSREKADELYKEGDSAIMSYYGELKALCEQTLLTIIPTKSTIIRPGLIVGPYDGSDRFTYWVKRVNDGGKILAPGSPDRMVQFIDVRDLAKWTIGMVEKQEFGIFNATGLDKNLTMESMLNSIKQGLNSHAEFIWVDEHFLLENEVGPWMEMPLWLPQGKLPDGKDMSGMLSADTSRALAAGLTFRSVEETAQDTLAWYLTKDPSQPMKAGMKSDKEGQLLEKWQTSTVKE